MTAQGFSEIFADPVFDIGSTVPTYERVKYVHDRLGLDGPLLREPDRLRGLLELAAMVDPRLFHVLFLHHCMTVGAALDHGAGPADLEELTSGSAVGAVLMTELGHGNSIANIRTRAVYEPDSQGFVLHSHGAEAVKFPPNVAAGGLTRLGVVGARLVVGGVDRGVALFLVRLRDAAGPRPGVTIRAQEPTSLLSLDYASVRFDHVRLPRSAWLADGATISATGGWHDPLDPVARTGRSTSFGRFAWGAVSVGLAAVARAGVAIALGHAQRRVASGRVIAEQPVIRYPNQQRLLFTALAEAVGATVLARRTLEPCWRLPEAGRPSRSELRTASLTKVMCDRLAERALSRCRAATGALGFLSVNRLIDYQGLALAFTSAGSDNQLVSFEAARTLLDDVAPGAPEKGPLWTREAWLHEQLRSRASGDGFTDELDLAERLAEAHGTRLLFEALAENPVDEDLHRLLELLELSAHDGWYLAAGSLTAEQVRELPDEIGRVCARLLPRVPELVAALDVPLELTRSPLGGPDYVAAFAPG
ncbi:acyl-CoA dehydrogenase family protein [Allokutzneria albata]|uniref:Acyl-coenzyme A oxidase n=1 Tax=Allokutzneria albata TaxID=211114 RepID=A0A1G9U9C0_ALLAB|nr:acyl-CoA dehydrogenase family protein [Allokutzneria albata]SDM56530.1 Acyl-coenzyme A oxidase [Allokutzneria albata]